MEEAKRVAEEIYDELRYKHLNQKSLAAVTFKYVAADFVKKVERETIEGRQKSREIPMVLEAMDSPEREIPEYLTRDGFKVSYVRVPTLDEVPYAVRMEPNLVVEFYSH